MNRNHGLDFLKFLCCLMVICIHTSLPNPAGTIIIPLTRIAVPIFFMITGYYYSHTKQANRQKQQLFKIAKIFLWANVLYFPVALAVNFAQGTSLTEALKALFNHEALLNFLLLNVSPFGGHLWYLGAILYVLLIVYLWEKRWDRKKLYPLIPFLLLADLVFGKYSVLIWGQSFPTATVRNFLCVGLPYFLIGDILSTYKPRFKFGTLILFTVLFVFSTLAERYILAIMNANGNRDHYISTTFLSICVFLLALRGDKEPCNKWCGIASFVGAKLSLSIYVLHPIVLIFINKVVAIVAKNNDRLILIYDYAAPLLILLVSIIVALVIHSIKNTQKIKLNNQ